MFTSDISLCCSLLSMIRGKFVKYCLSKFLLVINGDIFLIDD